jgi:hypothetical protein
LYSKARRGQSREGSQGSKLAIWRFPKVSYFGGAVRTTKRTEITIETDRIVVLSKRKVSVVSWCHECGQQTKMVTVDEAAAIAGVTSRTMYRWADAQKLHVTETADGVLMICRASLTSSENNAW